MSREISGARTVGLSKAGSAGLGLAGLRFVGLGFAVLAGACSEVWKPVFHDAFAPDAQVPPDAWELEDADLDAGTDAPIDAYSPDAWVQPVEICATSVAGRETLEGRDNDGDGLTDCDDPDCFGEAVCCEDSTGVDLGGRFVPPEPPSGWQRADTIIRAGSASSLVVLDFGVAGGHVRRTACAPLAAGAELDLPLSRRAGVMNGDLSIVLSPASSPSPEGFLDELALRFDASGTFRVTRAGTDQVLPALDACPAIRTGERSYDLDLPSRLLVEIRPGVAGGRSVLLVTVEITGSFGPCASVRPLVDVPIDVADLVRTTDGRPESCDESPGLYAVLEGHGAAFETGADLSLRRFECASPAVFAVERPILVRTSLSTTVPAAAMDFAAGGIGAPDLDYLSGTWRLTYDGSREDRSSEIFQPLTLAIGQSTSSNFRDWRGEDEDDGRPVTGVGTEPVREPTGLFESTDVVVYSRARGDGDFDLYRAGTTRDGVWTAPVELATGGLAACSFREPALAPAAGGDYWIFFRCDSGANSTLGVLRDPEGAEPGLERMDLLRDLDPTIASRVRALDLVTRVDGSGPSARRYFALWVLADAEGGARTLHLFAGEATDGTLPTFRAYAGNPVLSDADLREGCTGACDITSFGVGVEPRPGSDLLRFLFARTRADGANALYELVPRTQFAPRALGD